MVAIGGHDVKEGMVQPAASWPLLAAMAPTNGLHRGSQCALFFLSFPRLLRSFTFLAGRGSSTESTSTSEPDADLDLDLLEVDDLVEERCRRER